MSKKKKFHYHNQCDRFRQTEQGESDWQEMMRNAKPVSLRAFESVCDAEEMLDEGETLSEFIDGSGDPEAACYQSTIRDHTVLFVQVSGFEFIYTVSGEPIPKSPGMARASEAGLKLG